MDERFEGDGLIAFSDPAGAKACLAFAFMLRCAHPESHICLVSNKQYDFYADWDFRVQIVQDFDWSSLPIIPQWVFTGTSHPESSGGFERNIWEQAKQKDIPAFAFVDHWSNLLLRFTKGEQTVFPDHILVPDDFAMQQAASEGVPAGRIALIENPYLSFIRHYWRPKIGKAALLRQFAPDSTSRKILLYAPDPISLRNKEKVWQFDERSALRDIIDCIGDRSDVLLLVKSHPLQPEGTLDEILQQTEHSRKALLVHVSGIDNLELMNAADLIIGFYSNFLLEAKAMNKEIIRYFPSSGGIDPLDHLAVGNKIKSEEHLRTILNTQLC